MSTDRISYVFTVAPNTIVNIYDETDEDCGDHPWHVTGDLRAPNSGMSDDANYEIRDALSPMDGVQFDPETSCFYAYATTEEVADKVVRAIKEQMVARGRAPEAPWECDGRDPHQRGWWGMTCFNGLSAEQQHRLVTFGNLPMGYVPGGDCHNPAEVEVTTMWDEYPGPRFYCRTCAITFLTEKKWSVKK